MKKFAGPAVVVATVALVALIVGAVVLATKHNNDASGPAWTKPAAKPALRGNHTVGGVVKVAVPTPPELADKGNGGDALRSLVYPSLFVAQPDGSWQPSIVLPGSDGAMKDGMTAFFKLRPDLKWSDGSALGVADLKRTSDPRFVSSIDDPDKSGRINVHFKQPFPGWRMLWSGSSAIAPPNTSLTSGPFTINKVVSGAYTTLTRNSTWFAPAFVDSIELDYVPDSTMSRRLLTGSVIDVYSPVADTVRSKHFENVAGLKTSSSDKGGRWVALAFNSTTDNPSDAAVLKSFPRQVFVNSLVVGEAQLLDGFTSSDHTWRDYGGKTGQSLGAVNVTLTVNSEEPLASLLGQSLQRAVVAQGGKVQIRTTNYGDARNLIDAHTFDVALESGVNPPGTCWTCLFGNVDPKLAVAADAGDAIAPELIEGDVRNEGIFMPLWQDRPLVAYRDGSVAGISANGYDASPVWNAEDWWRP